ncbi:MAG: hypothetical protein AAF633_23300, partial [Chloroflexota bacterium]
MIFPGGLEAAESEVRRLSENNQIETLAGIDALIGLSWQLWLGGIDFERAIALSNRAESLLEKHNEPARLAYVSRNFSKLFTTQGKLVEAMFHTNRGLRLATQLNLKELWPEIIGSLGINYWKLGKLSAAFSTFQ